MSDQVSDKERAQLIARLKAAGKSDDNIKSYLHGWDAVGKVRGKQNEQ